MSWKRIQPPVLPYWKGMAILTLVLLATGTVLYLLLAY
jgi:hypothetical protein